MILLSRQLTIGDTVGGRNPAPVDMQFFPVFSYRVLYIRGGAGFPPSTVVAGANHVPFPTPHSDVSNE